MMTCEACTALLDRWLKDKLNPEEMAQVEAHLAGCKDCRFQFQLQQDCRSLDAQEEVPPAFSAAWRQRIKKEEEKPVKQMPRITRWLAVAAALVVLVGGTYLTGLNRRGGTKPASGMYEETDGNYAEASLQTAAASKEAGLARSVAPAQDKPQAASGEKIIRTARLELSTRTFDTDYESLLRLIEQNAGRLEQNNLYRSYSNLREANLVIRVPVGQMDAMLDSLKTLGRLVSFSQSAEDVSELYRDNQTRLVTQRTKMERLQELLKKADSVEDLIKLESSISDTQYQIDSLTGQLAGLDSRVDYATVSLSFREQSEQQTSTNKDEGLWQRIRSGVSAAFHGFVQVMGDLLVFLSIALPYLLGILILILIIRLIIKRRKNK